MEQVSVLLVGIGGYGETMVHEIMENPSPYIKLAGVVDPYPERCTYIEEIKKMGVPVCASMDEFYKDNSAHLAVISTPIFLHTKHILSALENGSNVLCEKPLCSDEKDIDIILKAKEKAEKFVYIGYQWSFSDAITNLKKDIADGKFGKLIEMKTLILRPRDREYFARGVGWAGKIKMPDGTPVYDSVANNSAAHYLFNMQFLMAPFGEAAKATEIKAELLRVNNIENFDTAKIQFKFEEGQKATFIAAHPVNRAVEPVFEYKFENGTVYYSVNPVDASIGILPENYTEFGNIVAFMNDGERKVYGNPMANNCKKMYMAAEAVLNNDMSEGPCGILATAEHTKLINYIQKNCEIKNISSEFLKEEDNLLYADGLFEKAICCYKDTEKNLNSFSE
ncbi:MAG: Gfo/Idh/MocA family oxidoreductase [Clostridia bacterium]|nr:Gfo/Idh/MocA family oxidoreductase [Clostridia bacterium]